MHTRLKTIILQRGRCFKSAVVIDNCGLAAEFELEKISKRRPAGNFLEYISGNFCVNHI